MVMSTSKLEKFTRSLILRTHISASGTSWIQLTVSARDEVTIESMNTNQPCQKYNNILFHAELHVITTHTEDLAFSMTSKTHRSFEQVFRTVFQSLAHRHSSDNSLGVGSLRAALRPR